MTGLPEGWTRTTLADTCDIVMGQSPPSETYNFERRGLPFFQGKAEFGDLYPTVVKWCSAPSRIAEAGDILVSVRAPVGPTNLAREQCCIGRGLAAIRPRNKMSNKYFLYLLRHLEPTLAAQATGTTFSAIGGSVLRDLIIPLAPVEEQYRLVAELESQLTRLDAGIAALHRVHRNLRRYRAAVLKAACEGRLVPQDPNDEPAPILLRRILAERRAKWEAEHPGKKYMEPEGPDVAGLPSLPAGWCWARVGQLVSGELSNGRSLPTAKAGFPILRLTAIKGGRIDDTERKAAAWSEAAARPFLIREGDFFVSRGNGSIRLVGSGALVEKVSSVVAYPDTMIRVPFNADGLDLRFVRDVWNSPFVRHQIERTARTTAGIYKINQQDIERILLPLPPLGEQRRIRVEIERLLSVSDATEQAVRVALARAERLRQAVLKRAFEGLM